MAKYRIVLNQEVDTDFEKIEKECYTGRGNPRPFIFKLKPNAVVIEYEMSKKQSVEYIIAKSDVFREALTKAYLCHALLFSSSLIIQNITVDIDGAVETIDHSNNVNFPFVFSLLSSENLHLNGSFKELPDLIIVNSIKYNQKELRFVSLASYLSSKNKKYMIDKFNALWTSINALYNYIGLCYENKIVSECTEITRSDIKRNLKINSIDANGISAVMYHLKRGCYKPERQESDNIKNNNKSLFESLSSMFQGLSNDEINDLYESSLADLNRDDISYNLPSKYSVLDQISDLYSMPSYIFVLLQLAYSLRCDLFHGNKATPIICSYNDRSIGELRVVNYFLDSFLSSEIPQTFTTNYYDNMHDNIVELMNLGVMSNQNGKKNLYALFIKNHQ